MKIISKFKDYYDQVAAFGRDESLIYVRHTEQVQELTNKIDFPRKFYLLPGRQYEKKVDGRNISVEINPMIIMVAGKLYPLVEVSEYIKGVERESLQKILPEKRRCHYDSDSILEVLVKFGVNVNKSESYIMVGVGRTIADNYRHFFTQQAFPDLVECQINLRTPVLRFYSPCVTHYAHREYRTEKNCNLANYQFYMKMDPTAVHQEISMFLGGILAPESKPMAKISDKDRIAQRGFDAMSFRKAKSKTS